VSIASGVRRSLAAATAVVLVAALLLAGWHRATVEHGRCVEHGEEIHLQRIAGGGNAVADAGIAEMTAAGWQLTDGDEHCEILASSHAPAAAVTAAEHHVTMIDGDVPSLLVSLEAPNPAVLFRLAPKTSPPLV
jgi:hypothetical protein